MSKTLIEALAITAELTGATLSPAAAKVLLADLSIYPEDMVLGALRRCRKEMKGRFCIQEIISRLDDGRPGHEEAWAMMPRDESQSVVWTDEMQEAWGVALPLLNEGDQVAARMAFSERYRRLCQDARDAGVPVRWTPSYGTDRMGRVAAVEDAMQKRRLTAPQASALLQHVDPDGVASTALLASIKTLALESR